MSEMVSLQGEVGSAAWSPPLGRTPELVQQMCIHMGLAGQTAWKAQLQLRSASAQVQQGPTGPSCFSSCLLFILHHRLAVMADHYRASASQLLTSPMLHVCGLQAVKVTLRRHPSIAIIPLLLFLALTTGGVIGVMYVAANETKQRRMSAEGAIPHVQHRSAFCSRCHAMVSSSWQFLRHQRMCWGGSHGRSHLLQAGCTADSCS